MRILLTSALLAAASILLSPIDCHGQAREEATVLEATQVLKEVVTGPAAQIPASILKDAYGVAIIPRVIKGGFVVGARYGRGVLLVREPNGVWHAPVFITIAGGNIGYQIGLQSTDLLLVFRTKKSVDGLLAGTFTIGADAAVAAGPVGREAAAATDARLKAEIYTYSRSRGLFAGVSLDGSAIRIDPVANATYYHTALGGPPTIPIAAQQLAETVAQLTGTAVTPVQFQEPSPYGVPPLAAQYAQDEATVVRGQLAESAPQMYKMLDSQWIQYLGLPPQIFQGVGHPSLSTVEEMLQRYNEVAANAQYRSLSERPEFQTVHSLLRQYYQALSGESKQLNLPAPPPTG